MPEAEKRARRIERIVIVGGGTAGWMAAIAINRFARLENASVTLIESPTLGAIGVGEATIPSMVEFVRSLNLDEATFMRRCAATIKLAIRFDGWAGEGTDYWHAFGPCGGQINGLDLFHFWLKRRFEDGDRLCYSDYSLHAGLCAEGKAAWPDRGGSPVHRMGSYAYHLDAAALADYLRELAVGEGVRHLFGHVRRVALDDRGHIASLDIGGERELPGDLFIDATGFSGLLVEQALGDPWIDWSGALLCDRAVAMPLPRGDAVPPYTLSRAAPAGWMWRIPLTSRIGNGYVYSSAHLTADEATAALVAQSGLPRERAADPRHLKLRIGRRTRFWTHNCVSIGLSSGFVEPLESTGIHLIHKAAKLLVKYWPDCDFAPALAAAYNAEMAATYDEVRDFIILHYWLARRDEPFWRDARAVRLPDSLQARIALYAENGRVETTKSAVFAEPSYHFIFAGNRFLPRRLIVEAEFADRREVRRVFDGIREENRRYAERMPSHTSILSHALGVAAR